MRTKLIVGSLFAFTALSSSAALLDSVNASAGGKNRTWQNALV